MEDSQQNFLKKSIQPDQQNGCPLPYHILKLNKFNVTQRSKKAEVL